MSNTTHQSVEHGKVQDRSKRVAFAAIILGLALGAHAETIMYNGFPLNNDATYFKGFTIAESKATMRPTGLSKMTRNAVSNSTLTFPDCFGGSARILPVMGGANDASLYVTDTNKTDGGIFDPASNVSGVKILKLSDNCQARTGSLHFRVLMKAEQGVLDALSTGSGAPTLANSQTCGLFWTVPDYFGGCGNNGNLRLNGGLKLSATDNIANQSGLTYNFLRGLAFSFYKDSSGVVSLRLFAWGSETASLDSAPAITLVDDVQADETYVCYAKIDIVANDAGDVICGMAQPVSTYDRSAAWPGSPFPSAIRSNLIGGSGSAGLNANFLVMGANKYAGKMLVDEVCLTTSAEEAVVFDAAKTGVGVVIAKDGFPCGTGGYSTAEKNVNTSGILPTTSAVFGFEKDAPWTQAMSKSVPKTFGEGHGLSFPTIYADHGIVATDGTSIGWKQSYAQAMMVYRELSSGLLALSAGETLNMRFLLSVTPTALTNLATGPDAQGTLMPGTIGTQANVNYVGAGLLSLPADKIETGSSEAPALCQRDNSCLFAVVKGSDGNAGLYLNLRSTAAGDPVSYKLANVDAAGGTYLCFATIEVGAGTDGKERIRAFGVNVNDVKEQNVANWAPENPKEDAIECELIDSASVSYPKQLAVGGSVCGDSFKFDEFALSVGPWYPLVWTKYPRPGLMLIFR